MKAPIAVVFANMKSNLGDFAILHAMLIELERRFPGHPVHVFSHGFRDVDKERLAAFRASNVPEFEHRGTTYFHDIDGHRLRRLVSPLGVWPIVQAQLVRWLAARSRANAAQFRDYEAIFLCGGDMWGGVNVGISMFATLTAMHHYNDRIYTFPISVNPKIFMYNSRRSLQGYFAKLRKPMVTRDEKTKALLDSLDVPSIAGVDCVFSLQSLAADVKPAAGRDQSRVLLVLTGKSTTLQSDLRAALQRLAPFTGRLALLTTCVTEDGPAFEALSQELGIPFLAPTTWQETVAEMKASSLVVTNRLHGLILSSLAETAVLPVTNRKKAEAFAVETQVPHSAPGINMLTSELLEKGLKDRDQILQKVARYRSAAGEKARGPVL